MSADRRNCPSVCCWSIVNAWLCPISERNSAVVEQGTKSESALDVVSKDVSQPKVEGLQRLLLEQSGFLQTFKISSGLFLRAQLFDRLKATASYQQDREEDGDDATKGNQAPDPCRP